MLQILHKSKIGLVEPHNWLEIKGGKVPLEEIIGAVYKTHIKAIQGKELLYLEQLTEGKGKDLIKWENLTKPGSKRGPGKKANWFAWLEENICREGSREIKEEVKEALGEPIFRIERNRRKN